MKLTILSAIFFGSLSSFSHGVVVAVSTPASGPVQEWGSPAVLDAGLLFDIDGNGTADYKFGRSANLSASTEALGSNRMIVFYLAGIGGNVLPVSSGNILGPVPDASVGSWASAEDIGGAGLPFDLGGMQTADAYIGVEFQAADGIHYGWIHYTGFAVAQFPFYDENGELLGYGSFPDIRGGVIQSWAWETEPGKSIEAGAIPEPASQALVGLGACGLLRRRRSA